MANEAWTIKPPSRYPGTDVDDNSENLVVGINLGKLVAADDPIASLTAASNLPAVLVHDWGFSDKVVSTAFTCDGAVEGDVAVITFNWVTVAGRRNQRSLELRVAPL